MLCKHWQLDWSEAHKNNPLLYWQNRTCEICFRIPYFTQSKKEQSHWVRFWGIFVPRQKTYLIKAGENQVNKGHDITSKYILSYCAGKVKFGFQRLIWRNFANGNSKNAGYYFVLFLCSICTLIILRSWMFTVM